MRRRIVGFVLVMLVCLAVDVTAESDRTSHDTVLALQVDSFTLKQSEPPKRKVDTIRYLPPSDLLTLPSISDTADSESRLTQNPTSALFRSLLLPGWGQIVNKSYLKAGLYGGLQLYFASRAIHHARDAHELYVSWDTEDSLALKNALYDSYLVSADARNAHRWYFGITTMISMFDAYVDAHLSGRPRMKREKSIKGRNEMSLDIESLPSARGLALVARF